MCLFVCVCVCRRGRGAMTTVDSGHHCQDMKGACTHTHTHAQPRAHTHTHSRTRTCILEPVRPVGRRSHSIKWLSVPSVTSLYPCFMRRAAMARLFCWTCVHHVGARGGFGPFQWLCVLSSYRRVPAHHQHAGALKATETTHDCTRQAHGTCCW